MSVCLRCHGIFGFKRFILSGECAPLVFLPKPRRVWGNRSGLFSLWQPLLCSWPWHSCRLGKRGSSAKANCKILQGNFTVTLPAHRLLMDSITAAPVSCHGQSSAWTWQVPVGFCGPLRKADESQFITAFEPCLPFPPVTWATKTKQSQFPPWLPLTKMPEFTIYAAVSFELLSLQDPVASFAFQKNWVYNALQWSPDSAKCLSPCLILCLQIALLVPWRYFRDVS